MHNEIEFMVDGKFRRLQVSDTGFGRFFQKEPDIETPVLQAAWDYIHELPKVEMLSPRPE